MLKNLLLATTIFAVASSAYAASSDFKRIENNIRVEAAAGVGIDAKLYMNNQDREFGIDYSRWGFTLRYERAEDKQNYLENRFSLGYAKDIIVMGPITFTAGLTAQYRIPDAKNAYTSDNWVRIAPMARVSYAATKDISVYGQVEPHLAYDKVGYNNFSEIVNTEWKVGAAYAVNQTMTVGAFLLVDTDKNMNRQESLIGTGVTFKF